MRRAPFVRYEGCQVGVRGDRAAAARWYVENLGFEVAWEGPEQTVLKHGARFGLALVPVGGPLFEETPAAAGEPTVQVTFTTGDLARTRDTLLRAGVRAGPLEPDGVPFLDGEGNLLRLVHTAAASAPGLLGYGPLRIGVRDLGRALAWYMAVLGAEPLDADERSILCTLGDFEPLRIEVVPRIGPDPLARPFLLATELDEAHRLCTERNLAPSPIRGAAGGLRLFTFRDPEGNLLGAWAYPR